MLTNPYAFQKLGVGRSFLESLLVNGRGGCKLIGSEYVFKVSDDRRYILWLAKKGWEPVHLFVYRVCLSQRASDQIHIPDLLDRTINWSIACKGITCSETAASSYFLCYLKLMVSKDSVKDVSSGKYYHSLESHISCTVLTFFFFFS